MLLLQGARIYVRLSLDLRDASPAFRPCGSRCFYIWRCTYLAQPHESANQSTNFRLPTASEDRNTARVARKVFLIAERCASMGKSVLQIFKLCQSNVAIWLSIPALHGALSAPVHARERPIIPNGSPKTELPLAKSSNFAEHDER